MRTATISLNTLWQPSDSTIAEELRAAVPDLQVTAVERAAFSSRYAVTFLNEDIPAVDVTRVLLAVMADLGYSGDVLNVEAGSSSSIPGGVSQAATETVKTASGVLVPVAVVAVVVLALVYLPKPKRG